MIVGELGLDGRLQPIKGALPIAIKAYKDNFRGVIVPKENVMEAAVVSGLEVYGMETMSEVIGFLVGANKPFYGRDFEKSKNDAANNPGSQPKADQSSDIAFTPTVVDTHKLFYEGQYHFDLDFADVRGQAGGSGGGWTQPDNGRSSGQWKVNDGETPAVDTPSIVNGRESRDYTDTQCGRQDEKKRHPYHTASVSRSSPHNIGSSISRRRQQSHTGRDFISPQRRTLSRRITGVQQVDPRTTAPTA